MIPPSSAPRGGTLSAHLELTSELIEQMSREALPFAVQKMTERITHESYDIIRQTIQKLLWDRSWAEPIIEDEVRKTVREWVTDMMESTPMAEARRRSRS